MGVQSNGHASGRRTPPARPRWLLCYAVVALTLTALGITTIRLLIHHSTGPVLAGKTSNPVLAVHVAGHELMDGTGNLIQLRGVNRARPQYFCVQGKGIMGGPSDDASIAAMTAWYINAVRLPLNEDCWLGINGVAPAMSGAAYRMAIADYVHRLHAHGILVILELHWNAPGSFLATQRQPLPDADHADNFWTSVATEFRSDPAIIFDVYNEPYGVSWACWRDGCTVSDPQYGSYRVVGMQELVTTLRGAGAAQPIMLGGLRSANDLSQWLTYAPTDPLHQLVASFHMYDTTECNTVSCWESTLTSVSTQVPVVTGEIGEHDCGVGLITQYMQWADAHGISYLAWAWVPSDCQGYPALISDWNGTPTPFGAGFRAHLAALAASAHIYAAAPAA